MTKEVKHCASAPGARVEPDACLEASGRSRRPKRDTTRNANDHGGGRHYWGNRRGIWRISQATTSPGPSRLLTERQPRAARLSCTGGIRGTGAKSASSPSGNPGRPGRLY